MTEPRLPDSEFERNRHAALRARLLAQLSAANHPALAGLTSRAPDDFVIALLDAWAAAGDVISFYDERIANESYLRTATERFSVLQLARLIGYEPRPGLAAETFLAFTLETAIGAPRAVTIAPGARVQSQPGPGELPQLFETVEEIPARPAWNALVPRLSVPQNVTVNNASFTVAAGAAIQPGDALLVRAGGAFQVRRVRRVVPSPDARTTRLDVSTGATGTGALVELSTGAFAAPFTDAAPLNANTVNNRILGRKWHQADLLALAAAQQWPLDKLTAAIQGQLAARASASAGELYVMRQRAALFGHNAPAYESLPASLRFTSFREATKTTAGIATFASVGAAFGTNWENRTAAQEAGSQPVIFLDAVYPGITPGGWVVLRDGDNQRAYQITDVGEVARTSFTLSAKVSRLLLNTAADLGLFKLRTTTVLLQSEPLTLTGVPVAAPVAGSAIQLDSPYLELRAGQRLAASGPRADLAGAAAGEVRSLADTVLDDGRTVLVLDRALDFTYVRSDLQPEGRVRLCANVARATHGESVSEIVGAGNARKPFPTFALRQSPLTFVSAATPSGEASTLELRVNDVLWKEVPTLVGQAATARVFSTRVEDDGSTTLQFGDGSTGARLPSGTDNVRATYRKGIGTAALLDADRLTLLLTRPLGVKDVTNPVPAVGADDPESRDAARRNAPLTVLTLGRIVSLQDYEDFARAFAGIARAFATWMSLGNERGILLTVSGPRGEDVAEGSVLAGNLLSAIAQSGDPRVPVRLVNRSRVWFRLDARVRTDPDFTRLKVLAQVEQVLRTRFGFDARDFGQAVTLAEVMATMHEVAGVVGVDVDALYRPDEQGAIPNTVVPSHVPPAGTALATPAELVLLDPRPLNFAELS